MSDDYEIVKAALLDIGRSRCQALEALERMERDLIDVETDRRFQYDEARKFQEMLYRERLRGTQR